MVHTDLLWIWAYHAMQARHFAGRQAVERDRYARFYYRGQPRHLNGTVPPWVLDRYTEAATAANMHATFARTMRDVIMEADLTYTLRNTIMGASIDG